MLRAIEINIIRREKHGRRWSCWLWINYGLAYLLHLSSKDVTHANTHAQSDASSHKISCVAFVACRSFENIELAFLLVVESLYLAAFSFLERFETIVYKSFDNGVVLVGANMCKLEINEFYAIKFKLPHKCIFDKVCYLWGIFGKIERRYVLFAGIAF